MNNNNKVLDYTGLATLVSLIRNLYPLKTDVEAAIDGLLSNIAPTYSNTNTYSVGDYVIYNGVLYVCNTAISVAEAFDSAKWTRTTITEIIGNISNVNNTNK